MLDKIKRNILGYYGQLIYLISKRKKKKFNREVHLCEIKQKYPNLNDQYYYFHHYFWTQAPQWLRDHRAYFKKDSRGFSEDAFHAMWYLIFKEYSPKNVLEIGIYRGQVISLWSLLAKKMGFNIEIYGVSPFIAANDEVSIYLKDIDYYQDVIDNFKRFELEVPNLNKGFSTDENMIQVIKSIKWDLIYIDGCHNYENAKQDFMNCSDSLEKNGLIILDDSALFTNYKPYHYSSAGHLGPSKVAKEIDYRCFREILSVGHNRVFRKTR